MNKSTKRNISPGEYESTEKKIDFSSTACRPEWEEDLKAIFHFALLTPMFPAHFVRIQKSMDEYENVETLSGTDRLEGNPLAVEHCLKLGSSFESFSQKLFGPY